MQLQQAKPMDIGRILDRSFQLYRKNFVKLSFIMLILFGPFYLLQNLLFNGETSDTSLLMEGIRNGASFEEIFKSTRSIGETSPIGGTGKTLVLFLILFPCFLAYALLAVALIVVIFAIYWFTRQLVRQGRLSDSKAYLPDDESIRSYSYYWNEAYALAASENWREGVRFGFLALLFYLEDQERIRVEKWKTNWEYAGELAEKDPTLAGVFRDCSLLFERIWYGREAVTETDYLNMLEQVEKVVGKEGAGRHAKVE